MGPIGVRREKHIELEADQKTIRMRELSAYGDWKSINPMVIIRQEHGEELPTVIIGCTTVTGEALEFIFDRYQEFRNRQREEIVQS